jgi:hypothetical protein
VYFQSVDGRDLTTSQLDFVRNPASPLADLVLRPPGGMEYRARFYRSHSGALEREIVIRQY